MSIPNLAQPLFIVEKDDRSKFVKEVNSNPNFTLMLQQLISALQDALSDEGYKLPQLDAATIAKLNTAASKGAIVYNTTTNKVMVCENETFKTIITS